MQFPFIIRNQITIQVTGEAELERVKGRLIAALEKQRAKNLQIEPYEIRFRGGLFSLLRGGAPLTGITTGWLGLTYRADSEGSGGVVTIHYRVTLLETFTVVTLAALLVIALGSTERIGGITWLGALGVTYAATYFSFARFLRTSVS